jgi:hypothetical protein
VHRGYCGQIRGARQQEAARAAVFVNATFDCQQNFRRTLHFINNRSIEIANEGNRICSGGGERGTIVKRPISATLTHEATHQRSFSGLSRTGDCHDPGVTQRNPDLAFGLAGVDCHGGSLSADLESGNG